MKKYSELFDEFLFETSILHNKQHFHIRKYNAKYNIKKISSKYMNQEFVILNTPDELFLDGEKYFCFYLKKIIKKFIGNAKKVLVVGLGNRHIISDSLGDKVLSYITPLLNSKINIFTLSTGVKSMTNLSASDLIKLVQNKFGCDCVILIDSLCATSPRRLANSYQIHNMGISPGEGVGNAQKNISQQTIGVPVITIGVPFVIYADSFGDVRYKDMIMTTKDVDVKIKKVARIIGRSLNMALCDLNYKESMFLSN